jgi:hypothetical protein
MFYKSKLPDGCDHVFDSREIWEDRVTRLVSIMEGLEKTNPSKYRIVRDSDKGIMFLENDTVIYGVEA